MHAYIKSAGIVSPLEIQDITKFPESINWQTTNKLACKEPDYRSLINPVQLRRMPRILKMGLAAAQTCIKNANNPVPDAIIVGTGLGCMENLENFLGSLLDNNEHILSVLPFINSTHNAVAAQIAMLLKNHSYNLTYCHRAFSFENALLDSLMLIHENEAKTILLGGIDEVTDIYFKFHQYLHYWKEPVYSEKLLSYNTVGTIAGEGASFFILSNEAGHNTLAKINAVSTLFLSNGENPGQAISSWISNFLKDNQTKPEEIDVILSGISGDAIYDKTYYSVFNELFEKKSQLAYYKHLCGEYFTSTSFALWIGATILDNQSIPRVVKINEINNTSLNKILIYNHLKNAEHSLILLSRA